MGFQALALLLYAFVLVGGAREFAGDERFIAETWHQVSCRVWIQACVGAVGYQQLLIAVQQHEALRKAFNDGLPGLFGSSGGPMLGFLDSSRIENHAIPDDGSVRTAVRPGDRMGVFALA